MVSGASVVSRSAVEAVRRAEERAPRKGVHAFRELLGELAVAILDAQPAMAPLVTLASRVLTAAADAATEDEARAAVLDACASFEEELDRANRAVADAARPLLPPGGRFLTLSASSTVRRALVEAAEEGSPTVICLESRPVSEGRRMARQLADEGIDVTFAVDAALSRLVPESDAVLLGADSVGDAGVVNKIGSAAAARAARDADVPVYVLTDRTKLLPPGFPQPVDDDRPGEEVWRSPPGIRIWNRYFERVDLDLSTAVITEDGALDAGAVKTARSEIPVPDELREWAVRRSD